MTSTGEGKEGVTRGGAGPFEGILVHVAIEYYVDAAALRYAAGTSAQDIAGEIGISPDLLLRHFQEAGLLQEAGRARAAMQHARREADRLPAQEVIERYEGGEAVESIAGSLAPPTCVAGVYVLLDRHHVVRHPGDREDLDDAVLAARTPLTFDQRPFTDRVGQYVSQQDQGRGESVEDLAAKEGVTPSVLKRWLDTYRRRASQPLSLDELHELSDQHAEGRGVSIGELSRRNGVHVDSLTEQLRAAGHVVSSREAWMARELEKRIGETSRRYRDEEATIRELVKELRAHGVRMSPYRLQGLIIEQGVAIRPADSPFASQVASSTPLLPSPSSSQITECRKLIKGLEESLVHRLLAEEESIEKIAHELGVKPSILSDALKESGHLPKDNLARIRKRYRAANKQD